MNGEDRKRRWASIKQRIRLKGIMGCCVTTWKPTTSSTSTITESLQLQQHTTEPAMVNEVGPSPTQIARPGMNLAMALAAERNLQKTNMGLGPTTTRQFKSLMRLIEETDGVDWNKRRKRNNEGGDGDWVCCVCRERSKGTAFIPCGHAFCRVCSRELWANQHSCAVCNRPIVEILDIY